MRSRRVKAKESSRKSNLVDMSNRLEVKIVEATKAEKANSKKEMKMLNQAIAVSIQKKNDCAIEKIDIVNNVESVDAGYWVEMYEKIVERRKSPSIEERLKKYEEYLNKIEKYLNQIECEKEEN